MMASHSVQTLYKRRYVSLVTCRNILDVMWEDIGIAGVKAWLLELLCSVLVSLLLRTCHPYISKHLENVFPFTCLICIMQTCYSITLTQV